ncbi:S-adenosyl-L-methionine-dependent tRNA 4-demethylwyosine synthase [Hamiltosporidium magnivora]|uniref:tRNA 4-demethylwyosine synthase (AdoMet-dependent) n=1 Tax=Hamiltosporidium magnivora TaxID=148818 RepID=A0A4V2JUN9_9MICR|nr:S-adenosyl-L-methionine-dependent tRNA 4-demethylwyosine synthase [Hamiltosporidium magnivora]
MSVNIFYATETNKSLKYAIKLSNALISKNIDVGVHSFDDYFYSEIALFITSTFYDGQVPKNGRVFFKKLKIAAKNNDLEFKPPKFFAIFGLGSTAYLSLFNLVAKQIYGYLITLNSISMLSPVYSDEYGDMEAVFDNWVSNVCDSLTNNNYQTNQNPKSSEIIDTNNKPDVSDIEDLSLMLTPSLSKNLKKQGYSLVGTHSAVKLCRWTKSMLKGRGGCYKNTFYGIISSSCMEATPNLACANKCVFCWRHYTNPVGTKWRWNADEPDKILKGMLEEQNKLINSVINGVKTEINKFKGVKHCALSLVGEPVMYVHIYKLIELFHKEKISTFLVTNGQFPDQMRALKDVTQLYLSIDAGDPVSLREIGRPLFTDYWERLLECIDILKEKRGRTVFRLTLVKGINDETTDSNKEEQERNENILGGYISLIKRGTPDFVEIKGVTFCGWTQDSGLSMKNVPYHNDVINFAIQLINGLEGYEIACEHEHSCCILIANTKYKKNQKWYTWINFDKFNEDLQGIEYSCETPDWALFGSREKGFNPNETRYQRKKNQIK